MKSGHSQEGRAQNPEVKHQGKDCFPLVRIDFSLPGLDEEHAIARTEERGILVPLSIVRDDPYVSAAQLGLLMEHYARYQEKGEIPPALNSKPCHTERIVETQCPDVLEQEAPGQRKRLADRVVVSAPSGGRALGLLRTLLNRIKYGAK